jgi:hypothetical protein
MGSLRCSDVERNLVASTAMLGLTTVSLKSRTNTAGSEMLVGVKSLLEVDLYINKETSGGSDSVCSFFSRQCYKTRAELLPSSRDEAASLLQYSRSAHLAFTLALSVASVPTHTTKSPSSQIATSSNQPRAN